MKTTLLILVIVAFCIAIGKPTINLNPFKVSFEGPYLSFALAFLILAILFHEIHFQRIGEQKGIDKTIEYIKKLKKEKDNIK